MAFGLFGAGDSKLLMALSLLVGLQKLLVFFVVVAIAGGVIAAASLAAEPTRALVLFQLRGKGGMERTCLMVSRSRSRRSLSSLGRLSVQL
jgi:Flp pilus assembly protein protease CpaA